MKKIVSTLMSFVLMVGLCSNFVLAQEIPISPETPFVLTEKFVKEATMSVSSDSNGETVVYLTNQSQVSSARSLKENSYTQTVVAILPANHNELQDIVDSVNYIQRSSGTWGNEGWFYGSSVYLSSTLYFSIMSAGAGYIVDLEKITLSCSVNSGTTISAISLLAVQTGPIAGGSFREQTQTFNATTARTFYVPASWEGVDRDSTLTAFGAYFDVTAARSSGSTQFRFSNVL